MHILQRLLAPLLYICSLPYALILAMRNQAYAKGIFPSWKPSIPCISIGNISWGGSGKTPLVSWIMSWAETKNIHPIVLTRGYKASPPEFPYVVGRHSPVRHAGDEPLMLALQHKESHVVVDPVRKRSGPWAMDHLKPDMFILDDGFQHRSVQRNLDIVCLNPYDLTLGWNKVIPYGTWRESKKALHRADVFLVNTTGQDAKSILSAANERLAQYGKPLFSFCIHARGLQTLDGHPVEQKSLPYLLVTGIANPERAVHTARQVMGVEPTKHLAYSDHHFFTQQDVATILQAARETDSSTILCTPKDGVKLKNFVTPGFATFNLDITFTPGNDKQTFPQWFESRMAHLA